MIQRPVYKRKKFFLFHFVEREKYVKYCGLFSILGLIEVNTLIEIQMF